jgi:hypothetical protein
MYIKDKDLETMNALIGQISDLIERGAEQEYWQELSSDAHDLFARMKKHRQKIEFRNLVKREVTKIKNKRK